MLNNEIKIVIPDNLRIKIDEIINQERNENDIDIDYFLLKYESDNMNQNNCYQNEVYYKCFYIFELCL